MTDNVCTLFIQTRHGSPASNIKVTTEVSGSIACIGGRSFYTDRNGMVQLRWIGGCQLSRIYIDGRGQDAGFRNGETHHRTI